MKEAGVSEYMHGVDPCYTQLTYTGPRHKQEINLYFIKPVGLGVMLYNHVG